jgi:hypothetical protein
MEPPRGERACNSFISPLLLSPALVSPYFIILLSLQAAAFGHFRAVFRVEKYRSKVSADAAEAREKSGVLDEAVARLSHRIIRDLVLRPRNELLLVPLFALRASL